jgi:hypothetical protein
MTGRRRRQHEALYGQTDQSARQNAHHHNANFRFLAHHISSMRAALECTVELEMSL